VVHVEYLPTNSAEEPNIFESPIDPSCNNIHVDKRKVRENFDRAATRYDEIAYLQRTVGDRLLAHLNSVSLQPDIVLDMGAGTGYCLASLEKRYPAASIIALDLAEAMLKEARTKDRNSEKKLFICGDAEQLPLEDNCVDLLFSNVTVQWCNDLEAACYEFQRVLRPGGIIVFSTFGPNTLWELRDSWGQTDADSHVNTFVGMREIGDMLIRVRFTGVVMDREEIICTYESARTLMRELKTLGAHNATSDRPRSLTGRQHFQSVLSAYECHRKDGYIPATYEVIYAYGIWK